METSLFLSIIVPVYNAQDYLRPCLDSLLSQNIPHTDYEILCVNDGSTDGSPAILAEYEANHPHFRVLSKANGGVTTARNTGLAAARGEYIWFVDSDDLIRENCLEALRDLTRKANCDRLIVGSHTFQDPLPNFAHLTQDGTYPDSIVWRSLLRRSFLEKHSLNFRYPELTHGEDGLFMYEVTYHAPVTAETSDILYFYRIREGSAETTVSLENRCRKLRSYVRILELLQGYYSAGHRDERTANKLMAFLWTALYDICRLPAKEAGPFLAQLHALGLYPGHRLPECTLEHAYLTSQSGLAGEILDFLCRNLHTRSGYTALRLLNQLRGVLRK